jgi:hypothetical protein
MSTFTINSKDHGEISFFMQGAESDESHYVFLGSSSLGQQLCSGGKLGGSTITATPETFESVCRKWHKQRLEIVKEHGESYA